VENLDKLVKPQRAIPPGHVCEYLIKPSWDYELSGSGDIDVSISYHLLYSNGLEEDTLVGQPHCESCTGSRKIVASPGLFRLVFPGLQVAGLLWETDSGSEVPTGWLHSCGDRQRAAAQS
jgi:hypothetical protein